MNSDNLRFGSESIYTERTCQRMYQFLFYFKDKNKGYDCLLLNDERTIHVLKHDFVFEIFKRYLFSDIFVIFEAITM